MTEKKRDLIEGKPALIVIDIQKSTFIDLSTDRSIPNMPGNSDRMCAARALVEAAHNASLSAMEYLQTGAIRQRDEIIRALAALSSRKTSP